MDQSPRKRNRLGTVTEFRDELVRLRDDIDCFLQAMDSSEDKSSKVQETFPTDAEIIVRTQRRWPKYWQQAE